MPGCGRTTTLMTLGYDPQKQRYVRTWIGSMMTYLWVYDGGELDLAETVLRLNSEGPAIDNRCGSIASISANKRVAAPTECLR